MRRKLVVAGVACAIQSMANAQTGGPGIETVVVTATKRAQAQQDVPQAITAFSEQTLRDIGAQDFSALTNALPGVEIKAEQSGQGGVAIRGISELNMLNLYGGTGSATGVYLDEMPLTAAGRFPVVGLFDMQRVEVLKGPQGTLFGEGSLAGTVRFIANKPKFGVREITVESQFQKPHGGGNGHTVSVMGNLPLGDNVAALRIVAFDREDGGYTDARITDGTTVFRRISNANREESSGGRVAMRIAPSDQMMITGTLMTAEATNGLRNRTANGSYQGSFSVVERTTDSLDAYNLNLEYAFTAVDLVANVAHTEREVSAYLDQAGFVGTVAGAYAQLDPLARFVLQVPWDKNVQGVYGRQDMDAEADTMELRLVSSGKGPLRWTAGAYGKDVKTLYRLDGNTVPANPGASWAAITTALTQGALSVSDALLSESYATIRQKAVFGEVSYDVTSSLQLLAGGRYFREQRESRSTWSSAFALLTGGAPPGAANTGKTSSLFNPKLTVTYKPSKDMMLFGTHSAGFRSGGQNDFLALTPGAPEDYDPERLTNNEIGFKSTLLNNTLLFNVSAYQMKWKKLQQIVAQGIGGIGEAIGNVGDATSNGLDIETRWMPANNTEVSLGIALNDATLDSPVLLGPSAGNLTVPSGTRIPGTAKQSIGLGITQRFELGGGLRGFAGGRLMNRSNSITSLPTYQQTTPGYSTVDLKLGVEAKRWAAYLFVDNVADTAVKLREDPTGDIYTGERAFYMGKPRTAGFNVRFTL